MTPAELLAISREPNVQAFLRVVRACEGTAGDNGYRMHFGGDLFDSFADHPRKLVIRSGYKSTAAGAYQFLERTWDGLKRQYNFPDFTPSMQDAAAVGLLIRRKALDAVRAGRLEEAIDLTNDEWASLPGSPYGQPTRTMGFVARVFAMHGGVETVTAQSQGLSPDNRPNDALAGFDLPNLHTAPPAPTPASKPMAPLVPALIGLLSSVAPDLLKIFSDKDKPVSERNTEAALKVLEVAQKVTGEPGPAAATEAIVNDPAKAQAFREAVATMLELVEVGGGIKEAREFNVRVAQTPAWRMPAVWMSVALLAPLYAVVGTVLWHSSWAAERDLRTQVVTAVLAVIGLVGAFWFGTSIGSQRKTDLMAER